jgi:prolipoprotein diacylglyceryltransferase
MPPPALPTLELALAPWLLVLCALGAGLALRARRAGIATPAGALLGACLPASLWLLAAALNPDRPTHLVLTPAGAGLAASFGCGLLAARTAARRASSSAEHSAGCYFWSCGAALLGAWLFHSLGKLGASASVLEPNGTGLSASGALLGALACVAWCFRRQPLRGRAWLDAFAPVLGLALALSWAGAYLQQPTQPLALCLSGVGLALATLAVTLSPLQHFHGQAFALTMLGYGIVQLSVARLDSARAVTSWAASVATWLVIALAIVAGWFWRKGFTLRGI